METKRIFYLDLLRALSIIGVLCLHTFEPFTQTFINWTFANQVSIATIAMLFRFAVPMYVMVSGALLLNRSTIVDSPRQFYQRRFKKIILPLGSWIVIFTGCNNFFQLEPINSELILQTFLFGQPFYLIFVLLGLYAITPFLLILLNNATLKQTIQLTALCLLLAMASSLAETWLLAGSNVLPTFIFNHFLYYLGYFLAGFCLTKVSLHTLKRFKPLLLFFTATLCTLMLTQLFTLQWGTTYKGLIWNMSLSPTVVLMSLSLFSWARFTRSSQFNPFFKHLIEQISNYSYGIYFVHMLVLEYFISTITAQINSPWLSSSTSFILAMATS